MPAVYATAPAKIILFGEHAVVYNRPAIAAPVCQVKAKAVVTPNLSGPSGNVWIEAPDIQLKADLATLKADHPLAATINSVLACLGVKAPPALTIKITSTIPPASGLGSGAAVSVATIRALSAFLGKPLPDDKVSSLAFEIEHLYHGTPSGIDNTVITYARPVYFIHGQPIQTFSIPRPFTIIIGDTGVRSPTSQSVGDVRQSWQADPDRFEKLFDAVGRLVDQARNTIERGDINSLGPLMNANQQCLVEIGVSSPALDRLVTAALDAGSPGAKLSGGGRGGNMIALASPSSAYQIAQALIDAGAVRTIITELKAPEA
jgi:mevalonate kinase